MGREDWRRSWGPWLRGTAIGFPFGAVPAGGAEIPTFLSYVLEKRLSKHPEEFGHGAIEGVAGPEATNNASAAGGLVPLLTLGLPVTATAAVLLAAFQQYGIQPGPLLLENEPELVWGLLASLLIGNTILLVLNLPLAPVWAKLLRIPRPYLYAGILFFASIGGYAANGSTVDLVLLLVFGVLGFVMRRYGLPVLPAIIGVILGPRAELQLRRALQISDGELSGLANTWFSIGVYAVVVLVLLVPLVVKVLRRGRPADGPGGGSPADEPELAVLALDPRRTPVTIVVGYVPKPEGEAALDRAIAEAALRSEDLVVVNSTSGGSYADASWATDEQLAAVHLRLEASSVPYELVHTVVGKEPADHVVEVGREGPRVAAGHRPAPADLGGQVPHGQQRVHDPHAGALPGAGRQGAGGRALAAPMSGGRPSGTRAWRLLLLHAGLIQAVTSVVRPTTAYRALELDTPPELLGLLPAAFAVLPLLAAVAVGRLADRRGERTVLVVGGAMVLVATVAFVAGGRSLPALVACSALLGLGHLLCMVAEQSLVADFARTRSRDAAFGAYTFASSAGQAVGPGVLAVVGGDRVQPPTVTLFLSGTAAAALLLGVGLGLRRGGGTRTRSVAPAGSVRGLLRVPGLPAAVAASLVVVSAVDVLAVYLPALGTERGLAASTVGVLLVLRALATMASRSLLAAAVARVGRSRLLMGGAVGAGAALAVLALPVPVPLLVVAVLVAGTGLGVGQPLTMSWVTLLAPERQRATAVSLRLTGNRLGQAVVPAVVGSAAAGLGAGGVLAATGTLLAGVTVVSARRVARTGTPERDDPPAAAPDPGDG